MALSDITKDVGNNVSRQGEVFIRPVGGNWSSLGQVRDVELSGSPLTSDPDTAGREKQHAHDVELTYVLMQTSDTEIGATDEMLNQEVDLFFSTETNLSPGDVQTGEGGNGYLFEKVLVNVETTIPFGGDDSAMSATSNGRVSVKEFARLGTARTMRFGD